MNTTETLAEIRELLSREYSPTTYGDANRLEDLDRVSELVSALDKCITNGAALPEEWKETPRIKFDPIRTEAIDAPTWARGNYCDGYDEFMFVTHYATHSTVHSVTVGTVENASDSRQAGLFDHLTPDGRDIYRAFSMFNTWESAERYVREATRDRNELGSRVHIITSVQSIETEEN